jgi:hypothetical protein
MSPKAKRTKTARCSQRDGPKSHMGNSSAKQSEEDPIGFT